MSCAKAKARVALLAAVAETGGQWTTAQSTRALSDLADAALEAGLAVLLRLAAAKGDLVRSVAPAQSGLAIFALGKLGGRELSYSSDIDIVAFFDAGANVPTDPGEATRSIREWCSDWQRCCRTALGTPTCSVPICGCGPTPGSTPVALSTDAALTYYESRGQNWERAAWIKARVCAGDRGVGGGFLDELAPTSGASISTSRPSPTFRR